MHLPKNSYSLTVINRFQQLVYIKNSKVKKSPKNARKKIYTYLNKLFAKRGGQLRTMSATYLLFVGRLP